MPTFRILAIAAALALCFPLALAQEDAEKKTDTDRETTSESRAQRLLHRAYTRVPSAEADGLKKLMANAAIEADASALGFGKIAFQGELWWRSGGRAMWKSVEDEGEGGSRNPLGPVADRAGQVFEPYLAFILGFAAWDVRFKDASFKLLEPTEDEENGKREHIEVTYKDEKVEVFTVAKNTVLSFTRDDELDIAGEKQKVKITFSFEYEDQGTKLRPTKISARTEIPLPEVPGQEPSEGEPATDTLEGSVSVEKWGKAGEHEIAVELKGSVSLKSLGVEFPTTLKITEPKINDDVKDEDFPDVEKPAEDEF